MQLEPRAFITPKMPSGREGCLRAHVLVLAALSAPLSSHPAAIFEDDAIFVPGFFRRVSAFMSAVPENWEVLWLGGHHHRAPRPISAGVVAPQAAHRSHAYVVRDRSVAVRLVANVRSHLDGPVVPHFDHVIGRVMRDEHMKVYAPEPWLVGQAAGRSDITGGTARERWS